MRRSLADLVPNPIARVMCWAGLQSATRLALLVPMV
jgi:hypothetical protein